MNCYYFGTFNPPHNAHITIADEVKKQLGFERVVFVPAFCPPHKDCQKDEAQHRLNMLTLAVGAENVSDIEYHLDPPSYTFKTIEKLGKCSFIIGYDAFLEIKNWKNPEYLKEMLDFVVVPRTKHEDLSDFRAEGWRFQVLQFDFMHIQSENVRCRVEKGLPIGDLVPKEVEEYIYEHRLYKNLAK